MKYVVTDKIKNETKFKFQGLYVTSKRWFDLDLDCIEVNCITRDPDFYKKLFQSHNDTQDINIFRSFQVPIGNAKIVESFKFQNNTPILNYSQNSLHSCFLCSLASAFDSINYNKADNAISLRI